MADFITFLYRWYILWDFHVFRGLYPSVHQIEGHRYTSVDVVTLIYVRTSTANGNSVTKESVQKAPFTCM